MVVVLLNAVIVVSGAALVVCIWCRAVIARLKARFLCNRKMTAIVRRHKTAVEETNQIERKVSCCAGGMIVHSVFVGG